jgi:hypothetical protein
MVKKNYILSLAVVGTIFLTSGCIFTNQNVDKVDVEKEVKKVDVIETTKEEPKEIPKKEGLDLSRPFIYQSTNAGYGTAEVTGYLTVETRVNGAEKVIFHLMETNSLEFLNFVGKTKEMDLGCTKDLPSAEYAKLFKSNKDNLIKIQIAKAPSSPSDEKGDCFTQLRNLKVIN